PARVRTRQRPVCRGVLRDAAHRARGALLQGRRLVASAGMARLVRAIPLLGAAVLAGCGGAGGGADSSHQPSAAPIQTSGRARVRLERIGSFSNPVYVAAAPADASRLYVVEQAGVIRMIRNGRTLDRPFLDLSGDVASGGERGLLSMAFAPDYGTSGLLYVYFTDRTGDIRIQQLRRSRDPDVADPSS